MYLLSIVCNSIQISCIVFCLLLYNDNSAQASSPVYIRDFLSHVTTYRKLEVLTLIEGVNELGCTEYA
jgi:hypothetical protein